MRSRQAPRLTATDSSTASLSRTAVQARAVPPLRPPRHLRFPRRRNASIRPGRPLTPGALLAVVFGLLGLVLCSFLTIDAAAGTPPSVGAGLTASVAPPGPTTSQGPAVPAAAVAGSYETTPSGSSLAKCPPTDAASHHGVSAPHPRDSGVPDPALSLGTAAGVWTTAPSGHSPGSACGTSAPPHTLSLSQLSISRT